MSVPGVRRAKAALSSGCKPHPATAPAGSNRSSHGGNEMAEAFGYAPTARRFKPVSSDRPQPAVDVNTAPAKAAREGLATARPVVFAASACASGSRKRGYLMV